MRVPFWAKVFLWATVVGLVLAVAAFLFLRWLASRIAHQMALQAEQRLARAVAAGAVRTGGIPRWSGPAVDRATRDRYLAQLDRIAWLMDRVIPLPFGGGIGLDALLGLAPVVGDVISLMVSSVIVVRAAQLGAPPELLSRLIVIQCIDLLAGAVPGIGDLIDVAYQADRRSVQLVREWLSASPSDPSPS